MILLQSGCAFVKMYVLFYFPLSPLASHRRRLLLLQRRRYARHYAATPNSFPVQMGRHLYPALRPPLPEGYPWGARIWRHKYATGTVNKAHSDTQQVNNNINRGGGGNLEHNR